MTRSPSFVAHFADGAVTRMSVYCADPRKPDCLRGVRLAIHAYCSRRRKDPPAIVRASFRRGDQMLVEYAAAELAARIETAVPKPEAKAKPKPKRKPKLPEVKRPALNAVGKPYSSQYDPKYRLRHKPAPRPACGQTGDLFLLDEVAQ